MYVISNDGVLWHGRLECDLVAGPHISRLTFGVECQVSSTLACTTVPQILESRTNAPPESESIDFQARGVCSIVKVSHTSTQLLYS